MSNIPAGWDNRPPPNMGRRMVVFRPDHKSFGEFILSEGMRDVVAAVCSQEIVPLAIKFTPRSKGYKTSYRRKGGGRTSGRHMQDAYKVTREGGTMKVDRALRVMVLVENDVDHAAAVEFGNRITKRHRPLGKAGAAVGDFKGGDGIQ